MTPTTGSVHDNFKEDGKTILVTGGAGFIGSNLVRLLLAETEYTVVNVDKLTYAGNLQSLTDVQQHPRYRFEKIDIACDTSVAGLFETYQPAAVMHLAAESHVDRSINGPGEFIRTNIVGTFQLLQATRKYWDALPAPVKSQFRFHHVSTDEVYGSLSLADAAFSETSPYDPHSPYSASKASSDHLVRAWGDTYGLPVMITNCSNNYGPFQFPEKLIPVVILKCLRGEAIPVYGKGENVRDWLYVEDHCRALLRVLQAGTPGETYNIGGNNERSNLELVHFLCDILDELHPQTRSDTSHSPLATSHSNPATRDTTSSYRDLITFVADRPGHDLRYAIDASKISKDLGWQPREQFETGFRKTVEWYLANERWWSEILSGDYRLERQGKLAARN